MKSRAHMSEHVSFCQSISRAQVYWRASTRAHACASLSSLYVCVCDRARFYVWWRRRQLRCMPAHMCAHACACVPTRCEFANSCLSCPTRHRCAAARTRACMCSSGMLVWYTCIYIYMPACVVCIVSVHASMSPSLQARRLHTCMCMPVCRLREYEYKIQKQDDGSDAAAAAASCHIVGRSNLSKPVQTEAPIIGTSKKFCSGAEGESGEDDAVPDVAGRCAHGSAAPQSSFSVARYI